MEHSTCPLLSEIPVKQSGQWSTKLRTMCVSHSCRLTERSLVLVPHHSGRQDCSDTSHEYCTDTHSWIVQMAEREREIMIAVCNAVVCHVYLCTEHCDSLYSIVLIQVESEIAITALSDHLLPLKSE